ncbi:hypothetical protein, partial [Actinomycetospora sp. NBRC 106375]|uniref:hypothetical protein n=1 Tax=Actinomycetospora sp. NBRC 106375 TaxID=3032207 RepID=UPI00255523F4
MCLLCRYHHQLVHHGHWTIEMIEGRPWFTPPWYIDTNAADLSGWGLDEDLGCVGVADLAVVGSFGEFVADLCSFD